MSNDSLADFRDSARHFLERSHALQRLRAMRGDAACCDRAAWREMAGLGWLAILVPEADGGLGLGMREAAAIAEEIGQALLPEPYTAVAVQAASLIAALADSDARRDLAGRLCDGALLAGLAWQEALAEPDPPQAASTLATSAHAAGADFVLNGCKLFVAPGADADGWIVSARLEDRPALFWVPAAAAGASASETRRVDGSSMAELRLADVRVGAEQLLMVGEDVPRLLQQANDRARLAQGAELIGVARRAFDITLAYLATRQQFGKPIGSFQALRHRAVDAYVQIELAAACLAQALAMIEREPELLAAQASRVKARCAHAALLVTRMAVQFHGAMGYTDECDIGLYLKRALQLSAWLGNAASQRRRYARLQPGAAPEESIDEVGEIPRDADWDSMPEPDFRRLVRAFFRRHYPQQLRNVPRRLHWHEIRDWYLALSRQGWVAPAWPKRFGGMGLAPDKLLAWVEEQEQYGVARAPDMGIVMIGPLLIQHGSAEQQQRFLPQILAGEHIWCQGYSEPGAGSDLAALRTEAVLDADGAHFVVSGHKIWTTLAQDATHMFTLVRTDKSSKQGGISFLLIDLSSPGITVRPIKDIGGHEDFCEVFLDQVRVPAANLVGGLNRGWRIAKALLGFERIFLGSPKQAQYALAQLTLLARERALLQDPVFAARHAELQLDVADLGAAYGRFADIVKRGEALPPSVSLLKIWSADTYQRICNALVEAAEEHGASAEAGDFGAASINAPLLMFNSIPATIYGGSSEIQRDIVAKQVLRLPD
jgi:alkylation response protein AidB-like acyl-CoA dehydrogenase